MLPTEATNHLVKDKRVRISPSSRKFHHFVHNIFGDRRRKNGQRSSSLMQFAAHKAWRSICSNYTGPTDLEFCTGIRENALLVHFNTLAVYLFHKASRPWIVRF